MATPPQSQEELKISAKEKKNYDVQNIFYSLTPIIIMERCFGIFRLRIIDGELVRISWTMKVAGVLIVAIYITVYGVLVDLPLNNGSILPMDIIDITPSLVVFVQYAAAVFTNNFFIEERNKHVITCFANLDNKLHINLHDKFYHDSRKRSHVALYGLILIHLVFSICDISTDEELNWSKIFVFPIYFERDLEILIFIKMINMIYSRLQIVNDYLTIFLQHKDARKASLFIVNEKNEASNENYNFIGKISMKSRKIRDLASIYDAIGELCFFVNELFNFQIFMNLVSTFVYMVITIWISLYYFRTEIISSGAWITAILWSLSDLLAVGVMSFLCERLLSVRKETKILVNEIIMDYDLPKTMRTQAKAFMELIDAWSLKIFVYEMFSVDVTLMLKFMSVSTTYLIVIVQIFHFV